MPKDEVRKAMSTTASGMRDAALTQKAILDAAEREFASFGLAGAKTETISKDTGVTKAMIHHYFKTKEGLYEAVITRIINKMAANITDLKLENMDPPEAIKALMLSLVDTNIYPHYPGIMVNESLQNKGKYFREKGGIRLQWELVGLIKRGIAQGVFRPVIPEVAALSILGASGFIFQARYNLNQLFPNLEPDNKEHHRKYVMDAVELVLHGIKA